jgi:hypothetical protein
METSEKIKFYYMYSNILMYFHNHIKSNIENIFDVKSILIDDIENKQDWVNGNNIKIKKIIECIENNKDKSIIFADCTIFINKKNLEELKNYINIYVSQQNDIVFANNLVDKSVNIGFMLINCNDKMLDFFNKSLELLNNTKGWDQSVINNLLKTNCNIKYNIFNKKIFCEYSIPFNKMLREHFLIFKIFLANGGDTKKTQFNTRLTTLFNCKLINEEEYKNNILS